MEKYRQMYKEGLSLVHSLRIWLRKLMREGLISEEEIREIINRDLKRVRALYMECHWRYITKIVEEEEG